MVGRPAADDRQHINAVNANEHENGLRGEAVKQVVLALGAKLLQPSS